MLSETQKWGRVSHRGVTGLNSDTTSPPFLPQTMPVWCSDCASKNGVITPTSGGWEESKLFVRMTFTTVTPHRNLVSKVTQSRDQSSTMQLSSGLVVAVVVTGSARHCFDGSIFQCYIDTPAQVN